VCVYDSNELLTTSIWPIPSPLDEHEDHHVKEQETQEDDLGDKLTVNVHALPEIPGTQTTEHSSHF